MGAGSDDFKGEIETFNSPFETEQEGQHVLSIGGVTGQQLSGIIKE
jgi:hypothetical protein